jgi:hypothetical protein
VNRPCPDCAGFGTVTQIDRTGYLAVDCETCERTGQVEATCEVCDQALRDDGFCVSCDCWLVEVEHIAPGRIAA